MASQSKPIRFEKDNNAHTNIDYYIEINNDWSTLELI